MSIYNPDMLNESGPDRRNALRRYGYSIRGKPAINKCFLSCGEHISAIAMMSTKGLLDVKIVDGGVNGDITSPTFQWEESPQCPSY